MFCLSEPEAGEVSPPVGAGVNSNSWTFKYGPGNPKQSGPGELPDKFIIPGSPAIISIRQEPANNQIDKSDFITFGKKEETKKKKKKKKGNKQEKKEKGDSTTDNSGQWGHQTETSHLASFCNDGKSLPCSNSLLLSPMTWALLETSEICRKFPVSVVIALNRFCLRTFPKSGVNSLSLRSGLFSEPKKQTQVSFLLRRKGEASQPRQWELDSLLQASWWHLQGRLKGIQVEQPGCLWSLGVCVATVSVQEPDTGWGGPD